MNAAYMHVVVATQWIHEPSQCLFRWQTDDVIEEGPFRPKNGVVRVPEGPGLGVEIDEDAVARYGNTPEAAWPRHFSVVKLPGGVEHNYRSLQQAENLMKLGVDESFAPGVRLLEREDDGSEDFDRIWKELQEKDWPIWE